MPINAVQALMTGSAVAYALLGLTALFVPEELAWRLGAPALSALLLQLLSAAWLSLAVLDWVGRRAIYGGIYGRSIVVANFTHGFIAASVLVSAGVRTGFGLEAWALAAFFVVQAAAFWWLLVRPARLPEQS